MATAAEMVTLINSNLAALYAVAVESLSHEGKSLHYADISKLEKSLAFWENRVAVEASDTGGIHQTKVTAKGWN